MGTSSLSYVLELQSNFERERERERYFLTFLLATFIFIRNKLCGYVKNVGAFGVHVKIFLVSISMTCISHKLQVI